MAHITSDSREIGILGAIAAFVRRAYHTVADAQNRLTAYKQLDSRSDNELARMGLTRGKIIEYIWRDEKR